MHCLLEPKYAIVCAYCILAHTFYGHLKTYLFPGLEFGALLSSYLKGALYKFLNE